MSSELLFPIGVHKKHTHRPLAKMNTAIIDPSVNNLEVQRIFNLFRRKQKDAIVLKEVALKVTTTALYLTAIILGAEFFIQITQINGVSLTFSTAPIPASTNALSRHLRCRSHMRPISPRIAADRELAVADANPTISKEFSTLHKPSLSWVSVPLLPGALALLSGGGFRNGSVVTLMASDGTEYVVPALDASYAALKFKMPDTPGPYPSLQAL